MNRNYAESGPFHHPTPPNGSRPGQMDPRYGQQTVRRGESMFATQQAPANHRPPPHPMHPPVPGKPVSLYPAHLQQFHQPTHGAPDIRQGHQAPALRPAQALYQSAMPPDRTNSLPPRPPHPSALPPHGAYPHHAPAIYSQSAPQHTASIKPGQVFHHNHVAPPNGFPYHTSPVSQDRLPLLPDPHQPVHHHPHPQQAPVRTEDAVGILFSNSPAALANQNPFPNPYHANQIPTPTPPPPDRQATPVNPYLQRQDTLTPAPPSQPTPPPAEPAINPYLQRRPTVPPVVPTPSIPDTLPISTDPEPNQGSDPTPGQPEPAQASSPEQTSEEANEEEELARILALSQSEDAERQKLEEELRRQEEEDFARALAASMQPSANPAVFANPFFIDDLAEVATSSKFTLDSPVFPSPKSRDQAALPEDDSSSSANATTPTASVEPNVLANVSSVVLGKRPQSTILGGKSKSYLDFDDTPPNGDTQEENKERPFLLEEEPEKVVRRLYPDPEPVQDVADDDEIPSYSAAVGAQDIQQQPSSHQNNGIQESFSRPESPSELAYYNDEDPSPLPSPAPPPVHHQTSPLIRSPELPHTQSQPPPTLQTWQDFRRTPSPPVAATSAPSALQDYQTDYFSPVKPPSPPPPFPGPEPERVSPVVPLSSNSFQASPASPSSHHRRPSVTSVQSMPTVVQSSANLSPVLSRPASDAPRTASANSLPVLSRISSDLHSEDVVETSEQIAPIVTPIHMNANQFIDPELLRGVSIGFTPPTLSSSLKPMEGDVPNIISLPYGRCPALHIQAPSWKHMLKLLARMSSTKFEPTVQAMAVTKTELKLRTVIQFIKPTPSASEWRTLLWFKIDHPVPPGHPTPNPHPNVLPYAFTLMTVPLVLQNASDSPVSRIYTVPSTETLPYPTLPINFPNLALYLQAVLDFSRQQKDDSVNGYRKLAKMVSSCYPNQEEDNSLEAPDRSKVSDLFKRVIGRNNKKQKGKSNNDTFELITPFVPDEWG